MRNQSILMLLALTGLVSSCELLYSGKNLFASLDGPDVAAIKSATGTELIEQLKAEQGGESGTFGDTFVEKLISDPGAVDTVYDNLVDIFNDGTNTYTPDTRAAAASLAADLILATSDTAGAVVNNVASALVALSNDSSGGEPTADELLVVLLGNLASDKASFVDLARDMKRIAQAYDALGYALAGGGAARVDPGDGQAALIAFTLTEIVDAVQTKGGEDPAAKLFHDLIEPAMRGEAITDDTINNLFSTDDHNPNGATNLEAAFKSVIAPGTNSHRNELYTAAGIEALISLLGGN